MKYFILIFLAASSAGCQSHQMIPHHVGIRSGVEWEIQQGYVTKTKPSIHGCLDWNL